MDKIIIDEAPIIPLFYDKVADSQKRSYWLRGLTVEFIEFKKVKKNTSLIVTIK
jgi:peptide/nickel transport system substrate-binding protein